MLTRNVFWKFKILQPSNFLKRIEKHFNGNFSLKCMEIYENDKIFF